MRCPLVALAQASEFRPRVPSAVLVKRTRHGLCVARSSRRMPFAVFDARAASSPWSDSASSHALCPLREYNDLPPFVFEPTPRSAATLSATLRGASSRATDRRPWGSEELSSERVARRRAPRSASARSPPDVELPRTPSRASDPPRISEEKLAESSTLSGALYGRISGLRAHITAPKSSSVNPTHLRSPKRLSVSSSSRQGPERPLCKPSKARKQAPKNSPSSCRTPASESSETLSLSF